MVQNGGFNLNIVLRLAQILIVSTVNTVNIIIIIFLCIGKVVASTGIVESIAYAGLVCCEEKRAEDLVTFAAAKDLNALLEVTVLMFCNYSDFVCSLLKITILMLKEDKIFYSVSKIMMDTLN